MFKSPAAAAVNFISAVKSGKAALKASKAFDAPRDSSLAPTNAAPKAARCFAASVIYPAHSMIVALFSLMKFEKAAIPAVRVSNIGLVSSLLSSVSSFFSDPSATS